MSETATPRITFTTLKNTELGATSISLGEDGSVSLCGVLKKVTESMLTLVPARQPIRVIPAPATGPVTFTAQLLTINTPTVMKSIRMM